MKEKMKVRKTRRKKERKKENNCIVVCILKNNLGSDIKRGSSKG